MTPLFLEHFSRPLLVLHALAAGGVVGLLTHHVVWVLRSAPERPRLRRQARMFLRLGVATLLFQMALGLLIYPTYRVRVRMALFEQVVDGYVPMRWASGLFDLKEHSSSLLLILSVALLWSDRLQDEVFAGHFPSVGRTVHVAGSLVAATLAWAVTIMGFWVTSYHGLPTGPG